MSRLLQLPTELLLRILSDLPPRALLRASHTCRRLHALSHTPALHRPHLLGLPLHDGLEPRTVRIGFARALARYLEEYARDLAGRRLYAGLLRVYPLRVLEACWDRERVVGAVVGIPELGHRHRTEVSGGRWVGVVQGEVGEWEFAVE